MFKMDLLRNILLLQIICFQSNLYVVTAARTTLTNHYHPYDTSTTSTSSSSSTSGNKPPKECKWQRVIKDDILQDGDNKTQNLLSCKLRTIGGLDNVMIKNLSTKQIERINALKLECSDVLFFESSLEANHHSGAFLGTLKYLEDLTIEYCKIRYVPKLVLASISDLKSLTLRTHNRDWLTMNLEFHPESFRGLTELRVLDLSDNNIWSLPTDIFCPLFSLRKLNLTRNHLSDISHLGFSDWGMGPTAPGKACNTGLEVLDLSHNFLTSLPDNGLSAFRSLKVLYLHNNNLSILAERSFVGLGLLRILNISGNRLIDLPPDLFKSTRRLEKLYLRNNSISTVGPGLLEGYEHLEILDLSMNQLDSTMINRDTFSGLIRLVILNISSNYLNKIDHNLFRRLYNLQILDLKHNSIETIINDAFSDLKNLVALDLSNNQLNRIDANHLSGLFGLTKLSLDSNMIVSPHERAFENLTNLNLLALNDNLLNEIPVGLGKLRKLQYLDLGKNRITSVQNVSFEGLEILTGINLSENLITNISRDAFITLSSVQEINLEANKIKHVDQSAFSSNPTIIAIRLNNNQLEDISGVFTSLPALEWLNVSDNYIKSFDYSHLPKSLRWLDMHKNHITELRNYYDIKSLLTMLDASYNSLTMINDSSILDSIEVLLLNNNKISSIAPHTFARKKYLTTIVLYGNEIKHIDRSSLILPLQQDGRNPPALYLDNNPLHCDCKMEWLQNINDLRQFPRVMDLETLTCTMEHDRIDTVRTLVDIPANEFLCKYDAHCFITCQCCDFDACDCKMTCPDGCSCYHNHAWDTNIVDCGNANHTEIPRTIPMDATTLYLDGNDLGKLGSHLFIGKKKLEVLYLNNSNIKNINNRTFYGIPSLKVLHLEHNNISELANYEFNKLTFLNELYLQHNNIKTIGNETFTNMTYLKVIDLSENNINNFAPWRQLYSPIESGTLSQVFVNGNSNRWKCDCASIKDLLDWIKNLSNDFDINNMLCTDDRIVGSVMEECDNSYMQDHSITTPAVQRTILYSNGLIGGSYVPILAAILVIIIGSALCIALICVFRQDVRLWIHSKYGVRLFKDPMLDYNRNNYLYDSFVVYSIRDQDFVTQLITFELQHFGYNLCLHHRDVHPTMMLTDAMQNATDSSKKMLLVLSMNFLQNEWSQPLYREAFRSVIDSMSTSRRRNKIIIILTVPIELVIIDPILQLLIRKCTVICWGEKRFWDKLKFALPDIDVPDSIEKLGNINRSPNLRYTLAPKSLDNWTKPSLHPGHAIRSSIIINNNTNNNNNHSSISNIQQPNNHLHHCISQSSCNTEDETTTSITSSVSSEHYEPSPNEQYTCHSSAGSMGHVYSTIPETPQLGRGIGNCSSNVSGGKNRASFV